MRVPRQLRKLDLEHVAEWILRAARVINGQISFGDSHGSGNIDATAPFSVVTPAMANTDFVVTHNLGRVPIAYLVLTKSAACDIYTGSAVMTATQATLRATVGGVTITVIFF